MIRVNYIFIQDLKNVNDERQRHVQSILADLGHKEEVDEDK